jgi:hypothetical protein
MLRRDLPFETEEPAGDSGRDNNPTADARSLELASFRGEVEGDARHPKLMRERRDIDGAPFSEGSTQIFRQDGTPLLVPTQR